MDTEFYRLSGILAFVIAWFSMLLAVALQGKDKRKSISLHAASSKKTIALLAIASPISMGLFIIFVTKWMAPNLGLSNLFVTLNILLNVGYVLAAWVPATGGVKTRIHNALAYTASLLLLPVLVILIASPNVADVAKIFAGASLVCMLVVLICMFKQRRDPVSFLYLQITYFMAFDLSLLLAGYIQ